MSVETNTTGATKVFLSYAYEDEKLKKQLLKHLSFLVRQGVIECWDVQKIRAGDKRDEEILKRLNEANIILCLLSASFIDSEFYTVEMKRALERQKLKEVQVVPILLRSVEWKKTPLGNLQAIPRAYNNKPIAEWPNKDRAFREVAREIERIVEIVRRKNA